MLASTICNRTILFCVGYCAEPPPWSIGTDGYCVMTINIDFCGISNLIQLLPFVSVMSNPACHMGVMLIISW